MIARTSSHPRARQASSTELKPCCRHQNSSGASNLWMLGQEAYKCWLQLLFWLQEGSKKMQSLIPPNSCQEVENACADFIFKPEALFSASGASADARVDGYSRVGPTRRFLLDHIQCHFPLPRLFAYLF